MDLLEVIKARRSIRMFAKKVPSKKIVQECLEAATWAPNPSNQQPWEFIVLKDEPLEMLSETIRKTFPQRMKELDPYKGIPEPCEERKDETFKKIFSAAKDAGIDAKDLFQQSLAFYGAPVAVLFITYSLKHHLYRFSTFAVLENFLLAAHARGLGTCWLSAVAACQEELRTVLGIAEEKEILDGVALGYPLKGSPLNTYPRTRIPVEEITTWLGF
jgi:nitroreductase